MGKQQRKKQDQKKKYDDKKRTKGGDKNQTPPKSEETQKPDSQPTVKGVNDPAWYNHSPQLVTDTASVPFNNIMGLPVITSGGSYRIPGVLAIDYIKSPGIGYTNTSPINVAARDIYSFIRHANSGSRNYEAVDYMLYLLAMGEAYSYVSYMRKILGCVNLVTVKNRFLPKGLYASMGVNYDDIIQNIAQLRAYANTFIARVSALKVPANMPIFKRWAWMDEYVFADHDDINNAQFYHFTPVLFRFYDETSSSDGGFLDTLPTGRYGYSNGVTFADLVSMGETIIQKLLTSEDIGIMSGDTIKAFGENVFSLEFISEDYTTPIIYDEEVLMTIQNSVAPGRVTEFSTFKIYQDPNKGTVKFLPEMFFDEETRLCEILNMPHPNPTPMDVMVATRLRTYCPETVPSTGTARLTSSGSEIVLGYSMAEFNGAGNDFVVSNLSSAPIMENSSFWGLTTFSWHPIVAADSSFPGPVGPLENVARLDAPTLDRIHEAALLSLFNVPINM